MTDKKGWLSTHVLDTAKGCPANGIKIKLFRLNSDERTLLVETTTNHDGRTDAPLLDQSAMAEGWYELVFETTDYFPAQDEPFLGTIPLRFNIADHDQHYHVPLLVSPYSYSTYRGS